MNDADLVVKEPKTSQALLQQMQELRQKELQDCMEELNQVLKKYNTRLACIHKYDSGNHWIDYTVVGN